jgi:hypothetical protein
MCKCLYCYQPLEEGQKDFHPGCARKFFGTKDVPQWNTGMKTLIVWLSKLFVPRHL